LASGFTALAGAGFFSAVFAVAGFALAAAGFAAALGAGAADFEGVGFVLRLGFTDALAALALTRAGLAGVLAAPDFALPAEPAMDLEAFCALVVIGFPNP